VADVLFTEAAARRLHALLVDGPDDLAGNMRATIAMLRDDPGASAVRRRRMRTELFGPCWVVPVRGRDVTWWVMWRADNSTVTVCYVGPEPGS
jgi:hypothetical protein